MRAAGTGRYGRKNRPGRGNLRRLITSMWVVHRDWTASQKVRAGSQGTRFRTSAICSSSTLRALSGSMEASARHFLAYSAPNPAAGGGGEHGPQLGAALALFVGF